MERIKATFGVGNIYFKSKDNTYRWKVSNINEIANVIIPHFIKFPLVTKKRADFELFSNIIQILQNKGHLNPNGLQEIVNLKASLNLELWVYILACKYMHNKYFGSVLYWYTKVCLEKNNRY